MLKYKRIFMSLSIVLLFAITIQLLRMNTLVEWSKASNVFYSVDNIKTDNIDIPYEKLKSDKYIIYYDNKDLISQEIFNNIVKFLDFTKKEYISSETVKEEDLTIEKTVIVATRNLDSLGDITPIINFLESGGNVIFSVSLEKDSNFHYIEQKLGIYESGNLYYAEGADLNSGILIGGNLSINKDDIKTSSLSVRLNEDSNIFVKAYDDNPLFWDIEVGKGKAVVLNNTFLTDKSGIGILTTALSKADEVFLYPIINSRAILLDYYPISLAGNEVYMKMHYGRNTEGFVRDLWWPDMAKMSSKYDFKYTSFFLVGFNQDIYKPFKVDISNSTNLSFIGREILRYGGELALSGYNDIPLIFNGKGHEDPYMYWSDIGKARESIKFANEIFKTHFQNYDLRCYSPPYGTLGQEGYKILEEHIKDLAVINGVYEGDKDTQIIQDFDINEKGIAYFPTVSNGFAFDGNEYWRLANTATAFGVISHSLDLREVMLAQDEAGNWNNLGENFSNLAENIYNDFGWMNSKTVSQAAEEVKKYKEVHPYVFKYKNKIEVYNENFIGPISFILRYEDNVRALEGCTITKLEDGFYLINATDPIFSIELGGKI